MRKQKKNYPKLITKNHEKKPQHLNGVAVGAIACIGCKTYFFCSLSIEETLKNI